MTVLPCSGPSSVAGPRRLWFHGPMHPHVVDPEPCAFAHGGICCLSGMVPITTAKDTAGDRLQVGIGTVFIDGLCRRCDGEDLIASGSGVGTDGTPAALGLL
jgi:hypothetical protein